MCVDKRTGRCLHSNYSKEESSAPPQNTGTPIHPPTHRPARHTPTARRNLPPPLPLTNTRSCPPVFSCPSFSVSSVLIVASQVRVVVQLPTLTTFPSFLSFFSTSFTSTPSLLSGLITFLQLQFHLSGLIQIRPFDFSFLGPNTHIPLNPHQQIHTALQHSLSAYQTIIAWHSSLRPRLRSNIRANTVVQTSFPADPTVEPTVIRPRASRVHESPPRVPTAAASYLHRILRISSGLFQILDELLSTRNNVFNSITDRVGKRRHHSRNKHEYEQHRQC